MNVDLASMRFPLHGDVSLDLAEANLIAAEGLPGADFDRAELLAKIDAWAALIRYGINRTASQFESAPHEYENSWAYFQVLTMITVVQRNLDVHYRYDLVQDPVDWSDSRTRFIHGPLTGFGGTCANLPVLYVAIGRRLGWPLYLVGAKQHLFFRWYDEEECFNIEASGKGLSCYPDEHYHNWPLPLSRKELDAGCYMVPFTPQDEQASFMHERATVLMDNASWKAALDCAFAATHMCPRDPNFRGTHCIASVLYLANVKNVGYEFTTGLDAVTRILVRGVFREPEPWERWAAPRAMQQYHRIQSNHLSRGRKLRGAPLLKSPNHQCTRVMACTIPM